MKIDFRDGNLIVFLNKGIVSEIDFFNKSELEKYFRNLFLKIDDIFNISLLGSYEVNVYIDKYYGAILEIVKNDDYFDCYVDIDICISDFTGFIYKLDNSVDLDGIFYRYNDSVYFEPISDDFMTFGFLMENCVVIYGSECLMIKKNGILLDNCVVYKIV